jgi:hypothetical protein
LSTTQKTRRGVGLLAHHLLDQPAEGLDPGPRLDPIEQPGVVDVPGGKAGECAPSAVFELAQRRAARASGDGRVAASERLQLRLLVGRDHELAGMKQPPLEAAGVEVEHPAHLRLEVGVAAEDPRAHLPGLDRVPRQPAPDRRGRGLGNPTLDHQTVKLSAGEARERDAAGGGQLAGDRLHLGDLLRGENGAGDPRAAGP